MEDTHSLIFLFNKSKCSSINSMVRSFLFDPQNEVVLAEAATGINRVFDGVLPFQHEG